MVESVDFSRMSPEECLELVKKGLERLSVQGLRDVREAAEEKLEEAKTAILEDLREKFEELGLSLEDVLPVFLHPTPPRRSRAEPSAAPPVRYRGPEGQTWSGRGHVPAWLQALEEQGQSRDEFLVQPEAR
jgi:DNA-binding protein H-NS